MSFASDIAKFANKTGQSMLQVKRVVFEQISTPIIDMTPVDLGRAKGNWQASIGEFKSGTLDVTDKSGEATKAAMRAVSAKCKGDDTLCLVNNLPYIKRLEDGHSQAQAPNGMVTLNVQRFNSALKAAVAGL